MKTYTGTAMSASIRRHSLPLPNFKMDESTNAIKDLTMVLEKTLVTSLGTIMQMATKISDAAANISEGRNTDRVSNKRDRSKSPTRNNRSMLKGMGLTYGTDESTSSVAGVEPSRDQQHHPTPKTTSLSMLLDARAPLQRLISFSTWFQRGSSDLQRKFFAGS